MTICGTFIHSGLTCVSASPACKTCAVVAQVDEGSGVLVPLALGPLLPIRQLLPLFRLPVRLFAGALSICC